MKRRAGSQSAAALVLGVGIALGMYAVDTGLSMIAQPALAEPVNASATTGAVHRGAPQHRDNPRPEVQSNAADVPAYYRGRVVTGRMRARLERNDRLVVSRYPESRVPPGVYYFDTEAEAEAHACSVGVLCAPKP